MDNATGPELQPTQRLSPVLAGIGVPAVATSYQQPLAVAELVLTVVLGCFLLLSVGLAAVRAWQARGARRRLRQLRTHDPLTALPNRDALRGTLTARAASGSPFAVLLLELDRFDLVNQGFGRDVGDRLIRAVAEHLATLSTSGETIGRWGGPQFLVISPARTADAAERRATELREQLSALVRVGVDRLRVAVSIGVVVVDDEREAGVIVDEAGRALAHAREAGEGVRRFEPTLPPPLSGLDAGDCFSRALEEERLLIRYRPIVRLEDNALAGLHASLHLHDDQRGEMEVSELRSLLDGTEQSAPVALWFTERVVEQAAAWCERFPSVDPVVTMDLSPGQVADPRFDEALGGILSASGLEPANLCLAITAPVPFDLDDTWGPIRQLKSHGVLVALGDFGAGWSSLVFLRRFVVDVIRIAPRFVTPITTSHDDLTIAQQLHSLAESLDVIAIADGVTTAEQVATLASINYPLVQGPLFGPPRPAAQVESLLEAGKVVPPRRAASSAAVGR